MREELQIDFKNNPKIAQTIGNPRTEEFNKYDQVLIILPKKVPASLWNVMPQGKSLKILNKNRSTGGTPSISTRLKNKKQTSLYLGRLEKKSPAFDRLSFARKMIQTVTQEKAGNIAIWVLGFDGVYQEEIAKEFIAAALARKFLMPEFKTKPTKERIRTIKLIGLERKISLDQVIAESEGNNLARWLTALPSNKLNANSYIELIKSMAKDFNWGINILKTKKLEEIGAGAFLAVSQGNENDSAAIVKLKFKPNGINNPKTLSLVGKGIIFDTGGTNLKPFNSMLDMHIDMNGSAIALGTLLAITKLNLPIEVDCWLAITENRTGPMAYKSQDVVTAANGKTIQTIHTDAEGRMVLADTLYLAAQEKPNFIIDFATLTGACMNAVTTQYSGIFTNRQELHQMLEDSGRKCGERVWPFPIGKEFLSKLKSETADLMQCSPGGGGDHILAATFLNEFVDPSIPWVHIDLSAATNKGGLAHVPSKITGFGVRFSLNLLLNENILNEE